MKERKGLKTIKTFSSKEPVVSMITFRDRIYIATDTVSRRIFMHDPKTNKVKPLKIVENKK